MNKKTYTNIEPNIWKHNTEQKYVIDIFLGRDENGKQQRTTKTYHSLKEARAGLVLAKAQKLNGTAKTILLFFRLFIRKKMTFNLEQK